MQMTMMIPIQGNLVGGSLKGSICRCNSGVGIQFSGGKSTASSPSTLHYPNQGRSDFTTHLRRTVSETQLIRSEIASNSRSRSLNRASSTSLPSKISEVEKQHGAEVITGGEEGNGRSVLKRKGFELGMSEILPENEILEEELEYSGGGMGKGRTVGGGRGRDGSGNGDREAIGAYYEEMLKANPGNPLLLRNYGKFLHEVEKDFARAEEYYGRALLASPGDGEVLSLYGKLIWDTQKDQSRAEAYFDRAVRACPDDCYVLGSYAHFLWDADEEEDDEEEDGRRGDVAASSPLVEAH